MARGKGGAPGLALWLGLAVIVILLDQITKMLILGAFQLGDTMPMTSFFNLVRVHNTGAAFSFLAGASGWQRWFFITLGLVASGFIIWMIRSHPTQKLFCFAVSMIMGGALGNVLDRALHGYVVDFLQFRFSFLEPIFHGGYFPQLQRCRQRDHAGRDLPDPGRDPEGAAGQVSARRLHGQTAQAAITTRCTRCSLATAARLSTKG